MKPKKYASQQNFIVYTEWYTKEELQLMELDKVVCNIVEQYGFDTELVDPYVVFADNVKEVKVVLYENGQYGNVVVTNDGVVVKVKL